MKPRWQLLTCAALCIALNAAGLSQTPPPLRDDAVAPPPDDIRAELKKLLLADSMGNSKPTPTAAPDRDTADAVVMSPYVVKERRIPDVREPIYEPPLMRFLRDGTLYENFGRKLTTRLRLRFYSTDSPPDMPMPAMFGNAHPRNGAQLGMSWSW